jgi:hypothetical protein
MRQRAALGAAERTPFQPLQSDKPGTQEQVALDPRAEEMQEDLPLEPRSVNP